MGAEWCEGCGKMVLAIQPRRTEGRGLLYLCADCWREDAVQSVAYDPFQNVRPSMLDDLAHALRSLVRRRSRA